MRQHFQLITVLLLLTGRACVGAVGIFDGSGDVGSTRHIGSADHPDERIYNLTAGGDNMWGTNDTFHFVWKKISGDVTLSADLSFLSAGGNPHRKACLLVRQS